MCFVLACLAAGIYFYGTVLAYIVAAGVFAYLLNPWVDWLERHRIPRVFGILIVFAIIAAIITFAFLKLLPMLINQAQLFVDVVNDSTNSKGVRWMKIEPVRELSHRIRELGENVPMLKLHKRFLGFLDYLNHAFLHFPDFVMKNYTKIFETMTIIATLPLLGFFLLKDKARFRKGFIAMIPNRYFEIAMILINRINEIIGIFIRALVYEIIIVSILVSVAMSLIGVPYPLLVGLMAGVANVIPYFGPLIGVLFATGSILLTGSPMVLILHAVITMYLIQLLDNNLIYPIVVGKAFNMHPMVIFLTVIAGGYTCGLVGMLVSVPLVFLVTETLKILYTNLRRYRFL